jgi:hypothetical protein
MKQAGRAILSGFAFCAFVFTMIYLGELIGSNL